MSTDPPDGIIPPKEEHESLSYIDSDAVAARDKPDVRDVRPRRASAGTATRRSRRKRDEDQEDKKDSTTNSTTATTKQATKAQKDKEKEPKPRARRQRDKSNAAANSNNNTPTSTPTNSRKKPKLEPNPGQEAPNPPPQQAQTKSPQPAAASPAPAPPAPLQQQQQQHQHHHHHHQSHPIQPSLPPYSNPTPPPAATASYPLPQAFPPRPQSQPPPPAPPQRTSGQNYDPIRSAFGTTSPAPTPSAVSPPTRNLSPRNTFRASASASPAIASIIDPPLQSASKTTVYSPIPPRASPNHVSSTISSPAAHPVAPTPPHHSLAPSPMPASSPHGAPLLSQPQQLPESQSSYANRSPYQQPPPQPQSAPPQQQPRKEEQKPQEPAVPAAPTHSEPKVQSQPSQQVSPPPAQAPTTAMDVDTDQNMQSNAAKASKKEKSTTTAPSSKPPSPKPTRAAKEAPPLPQGSGLISNALFGTDDSTQAADSRTTPNIILHIPLQGTGNRIVNFARLAEEQYGFAALHPRLAAHKERLARVAAAGAMLEKNEKGAKGFSAGESADEDLSFDVDRDSDLDGDVAMGGMASSLAASTNGAPPSDGGDGKKKRRKKKMEEYDRDDPFVDDSEMAWQEHAAASKDGFFVYSGPLVPEGEKVQVERADGTIKRGRGRGRGGRTRGPPTPHHQVPIAAAVPISQETGLPLRGPGSRGGSTTRRPRMSKAARQQMDQDRQGPTSSTSQGRGGGSAGRGGGAAGRGGKTPSMVELAPAPKPNLAPAPPGPSPLAGPELVMK